MHYAKALAAALDEAAPATGMTRAEIEAGIAAINEELRRPCGDALRIMMCADRAALRKALAISDAPAKETA